MDSYSKYLNAIIHASVNTDRSVHNENSEEYERLFRNKILNLDGPTSLERNLSKKEIVISKLFYGFNEIQISYERLKDHEVYIGRFSYSGTNISKINHLNYNVENYLNEFYILKERIKAYLTTIGRIYRNDSRHSEILKYTKLMFNIIPTVFDELIKARSSHVHQQRYTDKDFDRLSTIELLVNHGGEDFKILNVLYNDEYKKLRKEWKNIITTKNKSLLKALNLIFETLYPIVFTKFDNIRFPRARKKYT